MRSIVADTLLDATARSRGLFDPPAVERLIARHDAGENLAPRIWALLMLELWFRMWIDGADPCSRPAIHASRIRTDSTSVSA